MWNEERFEAAWSTENLLREWIYLKEMLWNGWEKRRRARVAAGESLDVGRF